MSFFDSEVVRAEMTEIAILQDDICANIYTFHLMNKEEKKFHINLLQKLLEKQQILYTRVSLSDDPKAKEMKARIMESATSMGLPENTDMNVIFNNMKSLISFMNRELDKKEERS
jgi:hypothetical protein